MYFVKNGALDLQILALTFALTSRSFHIQYQSEDVQTFQAKFIALSELIVEVFLNKKNSCRYSQYN